MEYLQVFDNKRNMLDEKIPRPNKFDLPEGKYFMVIVVFIENSENKFLLQRTSKEKEHCIATTGGHVVYGDDGLTTVIKETEEELGLTLDKSEIKYVDYLIGEKGLAEVYYVKKDIDINKLVLQEEEVESVNWYSIEEINKLIEDNEFRKGNIKPFEKVLEYRRTYE